MAEIHTAELCRFSARPFRRGRRVAIAVLAAFAGLTTTAVPAASARLHRHARHHRHPRGHAAAGCNDARARIGAVPRHTLQSVVVCLINDQRTSRGLPPLHESERLNRSAQGWSNVMVRGHNFSHGASFASRISAVGFSWAQAGENIAAGFQTPAAVVRAWMASPGHCRNILSPSFLNVGTGVSALAVGGSGGPGTWTQDFGLPLGAAQPSHNTAPANGCPY